MSPTKPVLLVGTTAIVSAAALLFAIPGGAVAADFHTRPHCWSEPRIYHDGGAAEPIPIRRVEGALGGEAERSPNGAYGFRIVEPDDSAGLSEPTLVLVDNERPYLLRMSLEGGRSVTASWVNEKLVFVRVWWGRIAGTDYLVDVEREEVVHAETVRFGSVEFVQFKEACASPEWSASETCECYPGQPEGWRPSRPSP